MFSVQRSKKRPFWKQFLDVVVSGGALGDLKDLGDNLATPYFLVASDSKATIVRVEDQRVVETIPVPSWDSAKTSSFRKADVADYEYRKVARIA